MRDLKMEDQYSEIQDVRNGGPEMQDRNFKTLTLTLYALGCAVSPFNTAYMYE